ncbi:hypothetical protein Ahy_B08g091704 [Arachis hypogaea]|uniref:Aminotransferase-like plant mobile domain-containing protein n=1 Tax=Arachis hypogaea TaxID=3818 RepID=A0A444Y2I6_ARAHY|nr:hypothetical protein Ahy_B08g091704 [Arachis hypogaea]
MIAEAPHTHSSKRVMLGREREAPPLSRIKRPKTHTFHISFGKCSIMLQDVAYQLGFLIDGEYVSGCLTDFQQHIRGGIPAWSTSTSLLLLTHDFKRGLQCSSGCE